MSTNETDAGRRVEDEGRRFAEQRELEEREPQVIEQRIDATRADMRATLEALERRWSVDRLIDVTVGRIRERGGEFAGNLTDAATQNPVPLLLTGIGLGWMILTSRRGARSDYSRPAAHERTAHLRERAAHAADTVHGAMESTRESVKHAAESSRETLEQTAESLRSGASRAAAATRDQVDHARARMDRLLDEQPLMLGAFGLVAGAIIGALLPTSEHEDRWFGEARDKALKSVAQNTRARYEAAREHAGTYSAPGGNGADAADERPAARRPH
jgi:ElaB/YqjD/DUF883 family membrane-anchored ribosome-binding protein